MYNMKCRIELMILNRSKADLKYTHTHTSFIIVIKKIYAQQLKCTQQSTHIGIPNANTDR